MHIPDGYLGPKTYGVMYAIMVPVWYAGSKILKKKLQSKQIPFLALSASFSFILMMFNIPIPGGSTGHAVGAALIAVLFGPWVAMFSVSIALIIQALLFGDGGITAIGANCFNIAFLTSFSGYYIYKVLASSGSKNAWKSFSAGAAAYLSLNIGALSTAIMFGLQPSLESTASGAPLYCPYGLGVAVPVMMIEHLLIFGFAEALMTSLVLTYILKHEKEFFKTYGFLKI